jgi:hypothetical protein
MLTAGEFRAECAPSAGIEGRIQFSGLIVSDYALEDVDNKDYRDVVLAHMATEF